MVNVTDGFVTAKFERRESSPFVYDLYSASAVLNYSSVESWNKCFRSFLEDPISEHQEGESEIKISPSWR